MFRLCLICITLLITACNPSHKKTKDIPSPKHFSYFEISYNSGWGHSFSFSSDSNSIFFFPNYTFPHTNFRFKYGRLPDSIFNNIDTIASLLTTMTNNMDKSKVYCYDCGQVSILSMLGKDTFRLYQEGSIDERVNRLITQLDILNRNDTASKSIPFFDWKTAQDVITLPPKVVK